MQLHRPGIVFVCLAVAISSGCSGADGKPGATGSAGAPGDPGQPGAPGAPGSFDGTFAGNATVDGNLTVSGTISGTVQGPLGEAAENAATSCSALKTARATAPSGAYWLKPSTAPSAFRAYCDMTNEGGGWTLVWSNTRGGRGKPATELDYLLAVNTLPRVTGTMGADLESFNVYTGIKHFTTLGPGGKLRYDWALDYGVAVAQRAILSFALNADQFYELTLSNFTQTVGATAPGLWTYHGNGNTPAFSAYNLDNDEDLGNCGDSYAQTPFWYRECWDGSIWGGGEDEGGGYMNGAYWVGSDAEWATDADTATGAGNGWLYVK